MKFTNCFHEDHILHPSFNFELLVDLCNTNYTSSYQGTLSKISSILGAVSITLWYLLRHHIDSINMEYERIEYNKNYASINVKHNCGLLIPLSDKIYRL